MEETRTDSCLWRDRKNMDIHSFGVRVKSKWLKNIVIMGTRQTVRQTHKPTGQTHKPTGQTTRLIHKLQVSKLMFYAQSTCAVISGRYINWQDRQPDPHTNWQLTLAAQAYFVFFNSFVLKQSAYYFNYMDMTWFTNKNYTTHIKFTLWK